MAVLMKNIRGTNNAFEYEVNLTADTVEAVSDPIFVPSNVATITLGIDRTTGGGGGGYKVQLTYSTRDVVDLGNAKWFDWDVPNIDGNGWLDQDQLQWWIPIPSHIRFAVDGTIPATEVNFAMRAN